MPIDRYKADDPFENHPLFKTEEQARLEETMDGDDPDFVTRVRRLPWPGEETAENAAAAADIDDSESTASGPSIAPATSTGATDLGGAAARR